jgi:hypothetical protein
VPVTAEPERDSSVAFALGPSAAAFAVEALPEDPPDAQPAAKATAASRAAVGVRDRNRMLSSFAIASLLRFPGVTKPSHSRKTRG